MANKTDTMVIEKIDDQGDRVLLFGDDDLYSVITTPKDAQGLKKGDEIEYEPFGINFGWFITKK